MAGRRTPPPYQLRKADGYSVSMAKGLLLAYPMVEGAGTKVANYGSWGSSADLTLSNVSWARREGIQGLDFTGSSSVASAALSKTIPNTWSYAFWTKLDTVPTGLNTMDLFNLRGAAQANLRAYVDQTGLWSWQKRAVADTYSVLPAADYPTDGARLVVATFSGIDTQPPIQLRTSGNVQLLPAQPGSYQSFNIGSGAQTNDITNIYLGNNSGNTSFWDGMVGPVYFWNRVITDGEVWQLWQDQYAPLRRRSGQVLNPALMITQADVTTEGEALGKPSFGRQVFSDASALFINIADTYFYQNNPTDSTSSNTQSPTLINITETYGYLAVPTDSFDTSNSGSQAPVTITLSETYNYVAAPTDTNSGGTSETVPPTTITITDTYGYLTDPTDTADTVSNGGGAQSPVTITQSDTYSYQTDPTETTSNTLT